MLNLKTVVFIGGQVPSNFFREFFANSGIYCYVIKPSDEPSSLISPDQKKAKNRSLDQGPDKNYRKYNLKDSDDLMLIKSQSLQRILKILLDTTNHNLLLVDKTSIVIGVLRKIQKWNLSSIISEYRLFTGKNKNYFAETFLELIDIKVVQDEDAELEGAKTYSKGSRKQHNWAIDVNDSKGSLRKIVQESDLLQPPEIPLHMMNLIKNMEHKPNERTGPIPRIPSALGIFGNKYRLAFNRKDRGEYEYYQSGTRNNFMITIPSDSTLPTWFKYQRDLWEQQHAVEEHNYYKETVFSI